MDDEWWRPTLREVFDGRDVIVAGVVPSAWVDYVEHLWAAGAARVMVYATEGRGVGEGPDVPTVVAEPPTGSTMMERIRYGNRALSDPPDHVREALTDFDPDRDAVVVGSFLNEAPELDGRPLLSYRREEWIALEDKTIIDAFWDDAGVDRLSSAVVPIDDAAAAAASIDQGAGTVWAADSRDGFHGGAHHTRWVAGAESEARALADLGPVCDRVRIMPFVDGVACSIHGIVLPDGVAVLRPVEMVTLRRGRDLVYAGCASFWDPDDDVRDAMRSAARRTADELQRRVDFRGTFTIDGVVDGGRFWPTELNPRLGAGVHVVARAGGNVPIHLLHELAAAGRPVGLAAAELERFLVEQSDASRAGGTWTATSDATTAATGRPAHFDGADWRWDGPPSGTVIAGPGFTRCSFEPAATPVGPSVGARAAAFWRFADDELGTGLGELSPAV
jgi:hypothetical protein